MFTFSVTLLGHGDLLDLILEMSSVDESLIIIKHLLVFQHVSEVLKFWGFPGEIPGRSCRDPRSRTVAMHRSLISLNKGSSSITYIHGNKVNIGFVSSSSCNFNPFL